MKKINRSGGRIFTILLSIVLFSACSEEEESPVAAMSGSYTYTGTMYQLYDDEVFDQEPISGTLVIKESPSNPNTALIEMDGDEIYVKSVQQTSRGRVFSIKETYGVFDGLQYSITNTNWITFEGLSYDGAFVSNTKTIQLGLMFLWYGDLEGPVCLK
jgi:hypothetical protein